MKILKIAVGLALVYVGIVAAFESLIGYIQPKSGSVLVITSARLLSFGAAAGTPENVQLVTFDASGNMGVLGGATIVTESNQQGHAELSFPTGVAVRPGSSICVVGPPRTTAVEVTGYFAKDR